MKEVPSIRIPKNQQVHGKGVLLVFVIHDRLALLNQQSQLPVLRCPSPAVLVSIPKAIRYRRHERPFQSQAYVHARFPLVHTNSIYHRLVPHATARNHTKMRSPLNKLSCFEAKPERPAIGRKIQEVGHG